MLHDTTEFSFQRQREQPDAIGKTRVLLSGLLGGKPITKYGLLMHSSVACLHAVAKLGGYLNRENDGPPGNTVLWGGLSRLIDLHLGFELHRASRGQLRSSRNGHRYVRPWQIDS